MNTNGAPDGPIYSDQYVLAYHEAGHAVVSWALSKAFGDLRISSKRGSVGAVRPMFFSDMSIDASEVEAKILLGGEIAERCLLKDEWDVEGRMSSDDRRQLDELATYFHDADAKSWIVKMELATDDIVVENWSRIEALAEELAIREYLAMADAVRIIQDSEYKNRRTIYW